jgi:hypothetical protein
MHDRPTSDRSVQAFARHLVEMLLAMIVGMSILGLVDSAILRALGLGTLRQLPLVDLAIMSVEMTVPMAGWMAFRGHAARDTVEMGLAMILPAGALVVSGGIGAVGPMDAEMAYHPLMLIAMVGLMVARRDVYAVGHHAHRHHAGHEPPHPLPAEAPAMSPSAAIRPSLARLGAIAAMSGIAVEIVAAVGHPSSVQPNDSAAVFAEYAKSTSWGVVHLGQFVGAVLVGLAVIVVAISMRRDGRGAAGFALAGAITALLGLAVFAVQMAVDGVALKAAIDAWIGAADPAAKASAFVVADVVRSLEKGLDGIFGLLNGASLVAIGFAILLGRRFSLALAPLAIVAGVGLAACGWLTALTGFSVEAASVAGPAQIALLAFLVGSAVQLASAARPNHQESTGVAAVAIGGPLPTLEAGLA